MKLDKKNYLGSQIVDEFINELTSLILSESITARRYYYIDGECNYQFSSFYQAYEKYCWKGKSFPDTESYLNKLSVEIQKSLKTNNFAFLQSCYKILDWGGGGSLRAYNIDWLCGRENDDPIANVSRAIAVMLHHQPDLTEFEKGKLRSNAGFTKIYAMLKPNDIVIYDSRVAASLGFYIAEFCQSRGLQEIPDELKICHMPAKEGQSSGYKKLRDPSIGEFQFNSFQSRNSRDTSAHAESNIKANWILKSVIKKLQKKSDDKFWNLRRLEASLFMLGYDLNDQNKLARDCDCNQNKSQKNGKSQSRKNKRQSVTTKNNSIKPDSKMKKVAEKCRLLIKQGKTKKEASVFAYKQLISYSKPQVIWVFQNGCELTANGASTYYYNCREQ